MEFSVPGFIKRYCTPNALLTLSEYLVDYSDDEKAKKAWHVIEKNIEELEEQKLRQEVNNRIERIKKGERDLYF
jgi:2-iminoacetate synthase